MSYPLVVKLGREALPGGRSLTGGKGHQLSELISMHFPVPAGFVITSAALNAISAHNAAALRPFVDAKLVDWDALAQAVLNADIPRGIIEQVDCELHHLRGGSVAVRSSASLEDNHDASFAGQFESFLNVDPQQLWRAVLACWTSSLNERSRIYRSAFMIDSGSILSDFSVIVQQMVEPITSGVCFTRHPVTGDKKVVFIEAVKGLGQPLVDNSLTPDRYEVLRDTLVERHTRIARQPWKLTGRGRLDLTNSSGTARKLSESDVIDLAKLAIRIEQTLGYSCDIEWAIDEYTLWVLQVRPITTGAGE